MSDFRKHGGHGGGFGGRGGKPSFGNKGGFRGNDRGPVVMTKAICDECKKPCEVPFRPTAGKPVYCNACFGGKKPMVESNYKTPSRTDFGNDIKKVSGEEIKKQIEVLNVKIDNLVKVIEGLCAEKLLVVQEKVAVVEKKKVAPVKKTSSAKKKAVAKSASAKGSSVAKKVSKKK